MDPLNEGHRAYQSLSDSLDNNLYTHTRGNALSRSKGRQYPSNSGNNASGLYENQKKLCNDRRLLAAWHSTTV